MSRPWTPQSTPPRATQKDFEQAARLIGCSVAEIRAVWQVEAAGRPFRADNSVERRFEPHHFPRQHWARIGFDVRDGEAPWRASLRLSNDRMAETAYVVDDEAMMRASSWGAPQIMGFNHSEAGFVTAQHMVEEMAKGEAAHLRAFVTLINSWGLSGAIRAHDWRTFARRYNGPGQVDRYSGLLARAFGVEQTKLHAVKLEQASGQHTGAPSRVVLRQGDRGPNVAKLQRMLDVADDGTFGPATERAVREFQKAHGLMEDGIVGARTWDALDSVTGRVAEVELQPVSVSEDTTPQVAGGAGALAVAGAVASQSFVAGAIVLGVVVVVAAVILWRRLRE